MSILLVAAGAMLASAQIQFVDATERLGLGAIAATRVVLADVNGDRRPDLIVGGRTIFLNLADEDGTPTFVRVAETGLPEIGPGDCVVFADLDGDGLADALVTRHVTRTTDLMLPMSWSKGRGDGSFEPPRTIEAELRTTSAVAVGDFNADGLLDVYLGNWYSAYGENVEAFANDLLIQRPRRGEDITFERVALPEDEARFNEEDDAAGRPTYGVMMLRSLAHDRHQPALLELNYGRRANRLWTVIDERFVDAAAATELAGDAITHGRYPPWLKERAKTDARFDRPDEKFFRSHGNTFDAAIGDVNADGSFDFFLAEITHGWAGESSDRSRFVLTSPGREGPTFWTDRNLNADRVPKDIGVLNWNQGDLFCELADFDHDGRLDLLISSGDYPDNQRLRAFRQQHDGSFVDVTDWSGIDHDGSQQIAIGDLDLDGDLDIVVGQSFNRYPEAKKAGREPRLKVYLNQAIERNSGNSLMLTLEGHSDLAIAGDALGAMVSVEADPDGSGTVVRQVRQLIGIGGHAGKQHAFELHFGIGRATRAERVVIEWNTLPPLRTVLSDVTMGRHHIRAIEHHGTNAEENP